VVQILADIPLETLMATFHEWLQRPRHALTVMENMSNKHSLIQKTSVEFQRETEMLRGGLDTLYLSFFLLLILIILILMIIISILFSHSSSSHSSSFYYFYSSILLCLLFLIIITTALIVIVITIPKFWRRFDTPPLRADPAGNSSSQMQADSQMSARYSLQLQPRSNKLAA
jgi:hypothetical protein